MNRFVFRVQQLIPLASFWIALSLLFLRFCGMVEAQPDDDRLPPLSRVWIADSQPLTLDRWMPQTTLPVEGRFLEISERETRYLITDTHEERRIVGDQIIAMDISWETVEAAEADQLFRQRKYREAIRGAEKAIESGIRTWQQRVLFAQMADSYRALGLWTESGTVFLALSKYQPPSILYASMPLVWTRSELDARALEQAKQWLNDDSQAAQLIGASWLLSGNQRSKADSKLRELSQSKNRMIASLASAQLWRTIPANSGVADSLVAWQSHRNRLLLPLQVGPTELIADKLDQAGKTEQAVPEWLRLAIVHRDRYDAASRAIRLAAQATRAAGKIEEANRIEKLIEELP